MILIHCENSPYSEKVHLRANCPKWHCQVWHVLSFSYRLLAYTGTLTIGYVKLVIKIIKFQGTIWHGLLNVANQILLSLIFDSTEKDYPIMAPEISHILFTYSDFIFRLYLLILKVSYF